MISAQFLHRRFFSVDILRTCFKRSLHSHSICWIWSFVMGRDCCATRCMSILKNGLSQSVLKISSLCSFCSKTWITFLVLEELTLLTPLLTKCSIICLLMGWRDKSYHSVEDSTNSSVSTSWTNIDVTKPSPRSSFNLSSWIHCVMITARTLQTHPISPFSIWDLFLI